MKSGELTAKDLSFYKKIGLRLGNFYNALSYILFSGGIVPQLIDESLTGAVATIASVFLGVTLNYITGNGIDTINSYIKVRNHYKEFDSQEAREDTRFLRSYTNKDTPYCLRIGAEYAINDICKIEKNETLYKTWRRLCRENGIRPDHSLRFGKNFSPGFK